MILEPDRLYYGAEGKYEWSPELRTKVWESCFQKLDLLLREQAEIHTVLVLVGAPGSGKSTAARELDLPSRVIFDGVFRDAGERRRAISIGRAYGRRVEAVYVRTPVEECLRRNSLRSIDRRVPDERVADAHRAIAANPPSTSEGFDAVHTIDGSRSSS